MAACPVVNLFRPWSALSFLIAAEHVAVSVCSL